MQTGLSRVLGRMRKGVGSGEDGIFFFASRLESQCPLHSRGLVLGLTRLFAFFWGFAATAMMILHDD